MFVQEDRRADFDRLSIPDLLNHVIETGKPVKVLYIHGHWLDVNNLEDLSRASDFTYGGLGDVDPGGSP